MKNRLAKPLREELITCVAVTVFGINMHKGVFSNELWLRVFPILSILGLGLCVLMLFLDVTKGSEKELGREMRDERNLMIQDQASRFCWRAENVLLILVWAGFALFSSLYVVSYVLYWTIILRYWLSFLTRWWMNRRY